jgi:hypothetical protein
VVAERAADEEDDQRTQADATPPDAVAPGADDQHERGHGGQVARDGQLHLAGRHAEVARHRRQRRQIGR